MTLGELCTIADGDHQAPPKVAEGVPFLTISDITNGAISLNAARFVPQFYYDGLALSRRPCKGDILFTVVGTLGEAAVVDTNEQFVIQRHIAIIRPREAKVTRFLFHALQSTPIKQSLIGKATGAAQKTIGLKVLREQTIPVPPLAEQQRIVDILDRFDSLTTSLTDGLPAEIEARRKQYEYYRDKLLTFKEKVA